MKIKLFAKYTLILTAIILISCSEKFNINQFETSNDKVNITGDTVYVQIKPSWGGFNKPEAMIIGKEPFIYVADTYNNRIVMMNLNGDILGTREVKHPVALAQDYLLNLIVCAEIDLKDSTTGVKQTYGAVFKFHLVASSHHIEKAKVDTLLPRSIDISNPGRIYTGVATFFDNSFYIARQGPNNSTFIDPDNSILIFKHKKRSDGTAFDTLIGRVANLDPLSSGIPSASLISSITSFNRKNYNIILTLIGRSNFKTQWLKYVQSPEFTGYTVNLTPGQEAMMVPNRFSQPEGAALDNVGNIFVVDASKDSVFKFNTFGAEQQSFGGPGVFKEPYDVGFFDRTLYILDRGDNKIKMFILSTDLR